jgi:peptidoglycan/xylan/chitin deacetylase (PgdA/CDA1 family)
MKIRRLLIMFLTSALFITPHTARAQALTSSWGGMVSFTFDDGDRNIYENAFPIFQKYGKVGVFFPVVGAIENQEDWIVTWPQVLEFKAAGWEIGSHTMTHPQLPTLTDAELDYELKTSKIILANHGIDAKTLAFPYGDYDARVLDYTTRYYENSREFGARALNGLDLNRYLIVIKEVSATTRPEEAIAWIEDAVQKKKWLVLVLHEIVTGTPGDYQYNAADLDRIVAYVAANKIPAPTIQQAMASRQSILGPNLIKNPKLEQRDASGWARDWSRNDLTNISVEPVSVARLFSSNQHLKILGSLSKENIASPAFIKLPDTKRPYLLSFFLELTNVGQNGGVEIYIDEYNAQGDWISGKWLGGVYATAFGVPGYLYQPSSSLVDQVGIYIYSLYGGNVTFFGSNFYFGVVPRTPAFLPGIYPLLLD